MKNPRPIQWRGIIPDDLWPEILSIIPVKSILQLRSVSKSWLALIDDPDFARLHLSRSNNNLHQTHLLEEYHLSGEYVLRGTENLEKIANLGKISDLRVISSVNGFFLLAGVKELLLWNPSIRKALILPHSPSPTNSTNTEAVDFGLGFDPFIQDFDFGLGFDPSIQDYRHVRLSVIHNSGVDSVSIYSLRTSSWKTVEFQGDGCDKWRDGISFRRKHSSLCAMGILCALVRNKDYGPLELVSFDLSSEMFCSTKLPPFEDDESFGYLYKRSLTMVDGGCSMRLVNFATSGGWGSVWVLEGLGGDAKSWSWSKRYTFSTMIPEYYGCFNHPSKFFHLKKNGEMLLKWKHMVTSYNLETHEEKVIVEKKMESSTAWPYMESLVQLK